MYNLHTAIIIYYYDDGRDNNNSENENGPRLMTIGPRCFGCPVEGITVLHCGGKMRGRREMLHSSWRRAQGTIANRCFGCG